MKESQWQYYRREFGCIMKVMGLSPLNCKSFFYTAGQAMSQSCWSFSTCLVNRTIMVVQLCYLLSMVWCTFMTHFSMILKVSKLPQFWLFACRNERNMTQILNYHFHHFWIRRKSFWRKSFEGWCIRTDNFVIFWHFFFITRLYENLACVFFQPTFSLFII